MFSALAMISSFGHYFNLWYEYDATSSIVEKTLKFKHILGLENDDDFVHDNIRADMGLREIATNVKFNLEGYDPSRPAPYDHDNLVNLPRDDYFECAQCKYMSIHKRRLWVCENYSCVTNNIIKDRQQLHLVNEKPHSEEL